MRLGIMQPYFFPYLGYFDLIHRADRWIVFDTVQYIRHGWVNRNRILHPTAGWQYVLVPLRKHGRDTLIRDVEVADIVEARRKITGQLGHYKKRAPFFADAIALVEECLTSDITGLAALNTKVLSRVCRLLEIPLEFAIFSKLSLELGPVEAPGDWALRICEAMGATEYLNSPGGASLFDKRRFEAAGIRLKIQKWDGFIYRTPGYTFEKDLSVLDALMWNPPERIREHLDELKRRDETTCPDT